MKNNMKVPLGISYPLFAILPSQSHYLLSLPAMLFVTELQDLRLYPSDFSAFMKIMAHKWIYLEEVAHLIPPAPTLTYGVRTRNICLSV